MCCTAIDYIKVDRVVFWSQVIFATPQFASSGKWGMTRNMQKRAPRITDVAKLAGVSTATVSRALSKPDTVAESTRNAVLAAARESGYRVNLSARNLQAAANRGDRRDGARSGQSVFLSDPFGHRGRAVESRSQHVGGRYRQAHLKPQLVLNYLHATRADGIIALDGSLPDPVRSQRCPAPARHRSSLRANGPQPTAFPRSGSTMSAARGWRSRIWPISATGRSE
jgi:hypothetical protein